MNRRQTRTRLNALLAGMAAIAAVCGAQLLGWLERIELMTLDARFKWVANLPQDPRIVCLDIDDSSLELVGRWPWSRDDQAALISIPAELGAQQILVDLTWSEAEPLRTTAPRHADIVSDPLRFTSADAEVHHPDHELRAAIASAGNVYLAYHYEARDGDRADGFHAAVDALARQDDAGALRELHALLAERRRWDRLDSGDTIDQLLLAARLVELLSREPTLTSVQAAERLAADPADVDRIFQRTLLAALRRIALAWLDADPARWQREPAETLPELFATLSDRPLANDTPFKEAVIVAFRETLGRRATLACSEIPRPALGPDVAPVEGIVPVYYLLAQAARRTGFVVFEPDVDGVMRRMRLVARQGDQILEQLAFSVACDALGIQRDRISIRNDQLILPAADPINSRTVQLDHDGRTLAPCVAPTGRAGLRPHLGMYRHVPAARLLDVRRMRQQMHENTIVIRDAIEQTLASNLFPDPDAYAAKLAGMKAAEAAADLARLRGAPGDFAAALAAAQSARALVEAHEAAQLQPASAPGPATPASDAADPLASARAELLRALHERCAPYRAANAALAADLEQTLTALRSDIAGRIVLIGYTATSMADMAPMPTDRRAPGVMGHANVLNGLLTGRMMRWTTTPLNLALAIAFGIWTCYLTVFRPPREAVFYLVITLAVVLFLTFWIAFRVWNLWIEVTPLIITAVLTYVTISIYVYIFVDRERRQLATALGQYTSKQIARQVAENPELCQRAEMRVVTAMFTDLRGFTTISERIGASRTQAVLNACLGRFTTVMLAHDALVNKFMGDGVFAFWNPVINPQADHARRACHTAIDLIDALAELKTEQRGSPDGAVFEELFMRIGVATGNAVVGPCGSDLKWDYTCIGDSVNLAARLESANKFYGSAILVSGPTYDECADLFAFRALGRVQVKGKTEGVRVFELLGRRGRVADPIIEYAKRFAAAVELHRSRQWRAAVDAFETLATERPDDLAAQSLLEAAIQHLASPPDEAWNGAVELTEK